MKRQDGGEILMSKLHIVMYHYTRDLTHSRYPQIKGLDIELFRNQIDFFKNNFSVVTMEEVIEASRGSHDLPDNALLLTFDDGYVDHYMYAMPILEEAGVQGSFFIPGKTFTTHQLLDVNKIHYILASANINDLLPAVLERMNYYRGTEFDYPSNEELLEKYEKPYYFDGEEVGFIKRMLQKVLPEKVRHNISSDLFERFVGVSEEQMAYELYMSEDQIRTMKRHGMFIGVHGYDHYWLGNLSEEQMKNDVTQVLEIMDEFIDRNRWVMCYPFGSYNENVLDFIQSKGACVGLTTEMRIADLQTDSIMELPRLDCNDYPPKSGNYKNYR